jgi:hypothetical protein
MKVMGITYQSNYKKKSPLAFATVSVLRLPIISLKVAIREAIVL